MDKIILASASPRRKMLLKQIGIPFDVVVSDVEEEVKLALTPEELVIELSKQKAINVANSLGEGFLVIGADTIVVFEGKFLESLRIKKMLIKCFLCSKVIVMKFIRELLLYGQKTSK